MKKAARRGDRLREHILLSAKSVFLETGFERASMDAVAARAETSKRTVYAHFESKENLFLAVVELVRSLMLERLHSPGHYADDPEEAIVLFCARYLESLRYESSIQLCRVSIAEATRFPAGAAQYYEVVFEEVGARLDEYLAAAYRLPPATCKEVTRRLLGELLFPALLRGLFGLDELARRHDGEPPHIDLAPIRQAVRRLLSSLPGERVAGRMG